MTAQAKRQWEREAALLLQALAETPRPLDTLALALEMTAVQAAQKMLLGISESALKTINQLSE